MVVARPAQPSPPGHAGPGGGSRALSAPPSAAAGPGGHLAAAAAAAAAAVAAAAARLGEAGRGFVLSAPFQTAVQLVAGELVTGLFVVVRCVVRAGVAPSRSCMGSQGVYRGDCQQPERARTDALNLSIQEESEDTTCTTCPRPRRARAGRSPSPPPAWRLRCTRPGRCCSRPTTTWAAGCRRARWWQQP